MNKNKVRGLIWNLKKLRISVLRFSLYFFFLSTNLVFNFSIFLSLESSKFVNSNFDPSFQSKSWLHPCVWDNKTIHM